MIAVTIVVSTIVVVSACKIVQQQYKSSKR